MSDREGGAVSRLAEEARWVCAHVRLGFTDVAGVSSRVEQECLSVRGGGGRTEGGMRLEEFGDGAQAGRARLWWVALGTFLGSVVEGTGMATVRVVVLLTAVFVAVCHSAMHLTPVASMTGGSGVL